MKVFDSPYLMQEQALAWRGAGEEIGFVPTMGALHAGHESLVKRARSENKRVIVSVFVNPKQFGPHEDFSRYPRPFERDSEILEGLGVDAIFRPDVEQMYPSAFKTFIDPGPLAEKLEGQIRPGHFRGVLTVVLKLFVITQPKRAYFGQKDIQQLILVRQLVRDLNLPVRIVACPTVREPDGLAMSSRNAYLDPVQRRRAPALFKALRAGQDAFVAGETDPRKVERVARQVLEQAGLAVDYVCVFDELEMERPKTIGGGNILAAAVNIGQTRLIDNVILGAGN